MAAMALGHLRTRYSHVQGDHSAPEGAAPTAEQGAAAQQALGPSASGASATSMEICFKWGKQEVRVHAEPDETVQVRRPSTVAPLIFQGKHVVAWSAPHAHPPT